MIMLAVPTDKLKPGIILAEEVLDINGRLLLAKGNEIDDNHIRIFKFWGGGVVTVEGRARQSVKFDPELNPRMWSTMTRTLCERIGVTPADVDRYFITQININSIRETMSELGLPMKRTHCVMDRYGYTGSACIPMCLAEADIAGRLSPGDLVVFMGSGAGLSFACAAFTW